MLSKKSSLKIGVAAFVVMIMSAILVTDVVAQQRRQSRRGRQTTRRAGALPQPSIITSGQSDAEIVSTDDARAAAEERQGSRGSASSSSRAATRNENPQGTIERLTTEVNTLRAELKSVRDDQRTLVDLERLSRTEQRAESYRTQLLQTQEKEGAIQARLAQIEIELEPQNVEIRASQVGTTRPDAVRAQLRVGLESERKRLLSQLNLLTQSRVRLETTLVSADAEVDRLRKRVEGDNSAQTNNLEVPQAVTGEGNSEPEVPPM